MTSDDEWIEDVSFTVGPEQAGTRLDVFLALSDDSFSRSQIKYAIEAGRVRVNGKESKASLRLKAWDTVTMRVEQAQEVLAVAQDIPLDIVYEDDAIIVVNKPAGMVVHPAPGNPDQTLVNALLFHCRDLSGIGGALRPGIVHRLDKETSGLIVAAKTDEAHRRLSAQFESRDVHKKYLALVWGDVKGGRGDIVLPIGRHPADRKKMSTKSRYGKAALTLWRVKERFGTATLLDVEIKTGRTHQIRVHLTERGWPIVGDTVYGTPRLQTIKDPALRSQIKGLNRHALHAAQLSFLHPQTHERMVFVSPLPPDMETLLSAFRAAIPSAPRESSLQSGKDQLKE